MAAFVVYVAVIAGLWVAGLSGFVSAVKTPEYVYRSAEHSKPGTIIGIVLTCGFGGAYYWLRVRPDLKEAVKYATPPPRRDPWAED